MEVTHFPALLLCSAPTDRDHISPGRNWCTTKDNKCSNKKDKCYPFTDKELLSTFIALEMTDNRKCPFENEAQYKKEQKDCIDGKGGGPAPAPPSIAWDFWERPTAPVLCQEPAFCGP